MSDINIELSKGIVDGLEDLIDMNFGDYFGSLHETIRKTDNDQEAESLSRTMRRMMTTLFVMGIQAGIDVKKFDVDGLIPIYAPNLLEE